MAVRIPNNLTPQVWFRERSPERRKRDHMSRQFVYVAHGTTSPIPPHEREETADRPFHVGTTTAAHQRMFQSREYFSHIYRISRDVMTPEIFGDDKPGGPIFEETQEGIQPTLWESVSHSNKGVEAFHNSENPRVLPYRNTVEDTGSTSFVVPRSLVGRGVEYLGRWDSHRDPKNEAERKLWAERNRILFGIREDD